MKTFRYFINLFFASFFLISGLWAQPAGCYRRMEDASGYTPTSEQLAELEAAACALVDSFPAEFRDSFRVYDFGFYLHQEVTEGGYPEPFAKKILEVQDSSPYYLLFGKQTDRTGVYTRFWVDFKLPNSNSFSCLDTAGRTMISLGIDLKVNTQHTNSQKLPYFFHEAEIAGMKRLEDEVVKLIECCYYSKGANSCENPCLTSEEIRIYFENHKFSSVPISIINSSSKHSQTLDTNNILTNKINSNNYTNMFEDFSDLNIIMNEDILDIDDLIDKLLSSVSFFGQSKFILTDNESFCNVKIDNYINEINSGLTPLYLFLHLWKNPHENQGDYLYFKVFIGDPSATIDLSFYGHLPLEENLVHNIDTTYTKNTILTIYNKNRFIISVDFEDENTLTYDDLYNKILYDAPGTSSSPGFSQVDDNGVSYKSNFIQYFHFRDRVYKNSVQLSYTLGYIASHEFLHQILCKSYDFITFDQRYKYSRRVSIEGPDGGHAIDSRNLLFPGDGLSRYKTFALPEDHSCGGCVELLLFSGKYIPTSNKPTNTNPWEEIVMNQKRLIYLCHALRNVEHQYGSNSDELKHWRSIFTEITVKLECWKS